MADSQGQGLLETLQEDYQGFIIFVHQAGGLVRGKKTLCQWLEDSLKLLKIKATTLSVDTLMKESTTNATIRSKSKKKNPKIVIRALRSNSVNKNQPLLASLLNSSTSNQANNKPVQAAGGGVARPQASVTSRITYSKSRQIKPALSNKTSGQMHSQNWSKMGAGVGQQVVLPAPVDPNCVHLGVFKSYLKQMGILEDICWVLIIESHYKLVMDMDELEDLSREFAFKTFWISAYSKQNTEQCIFDIVNEIFVYKNELLRKKLEYLRALNPADIMLLNSNISSAISTNVNSKQPSSSSRKFSRSRSRSKSSTVKKYKADSQVQFEASDYASKARLKFGKNVSVPKWTSLVQCTGSGTGPNSNCSKPPRTMVDYETSDDPSDSETDAEFHQETTNEKKLINCIEKLKLIDSVGNGGIGGGGGLDSKMILQEMDENLKKRVALLIVQDLLRDQDENEN